MATFLTKSVLSEWDDWGLVRRQLTQSPFEVEMAIHKVCVSFRDMLGIDTAEAKDVFGKSEAGEKELHTLKEIWNLGLLQQKDAVHLGKLLAHLWLSRQAMTNLGLWKPSRRLLEEMKAGAWIDRVWQEMCDIRKHEVAEALFKVEILQKIISLEDPSDFLWNTFDIDPRALLAVAMGTA